MSDDTARVYHFTDTARLPWIVFDQLLNISWNGIGGYPEPQFLWATTDERGDATATAMGESGAALFRSGHSLHVRLTLHAEDFEPWPQITERFPAWTPDQVARLDAVGRKLGGDPATWRARADPLSLARAIACETRSHRDLTWRPLPMPLTVFRFEADALAIKVGRVAYASRRYTEEHTGCRGYRCEVIWGPALEEIERVGLVR